MRADQHGIPHSHCRAYNIGILSVAKGCRFARPAPLEAKPGRGYFLCRKRTSSRHTCEALTARRNWMHAKAQLTNNAVDFKGTARVAVVGASNQSINRFAANVRA